MHLSLAELLKGKDEQDFSAYDIGSKAHYRWSKKDYTSAATLFEAASRVAKVEHESNRVESNQFLNYYCRAGICYSMGGDIDKAKPILENTIDSDWLAAGLSKDLHMIEWCYFELLAHEEITNPDSFEALFQKAKKHCEVLGWAFPRIHPKQESLLEIAVDLGLRDIAMDIISLIKSRKPISRQTRSRLKEIEALYA